MHVQCMLCVYNVSMSIVGELVQVMCAECGDVSERTEETSEFEEDREERKKKGTHAATRCM